MLMLKRMVLDIWGCKKRKKKEEQTTGELVSIYV
jgi:hypothetical protein